MKRRRTSVRDESRLLRAASGEEDLRSHGSRGRKTHDALPADVPVEASTSQGDVPDPSPETATFGALAADLEAQLNEWEQAMFRPPPIEPVIAADAAVADDKRDLTYFEAAGLPPLFDPEPQSLTGDDLNHALVWAARNEVSDVYIASGHRLRARRRGRLIDLTRRALEVLETQNLLTRIRPNSEATLLQGKYVDTRYDFAPTRAERYGFRVCATRGMEANGGDQAVEIVLRSLPYKIPTVAELKVEAEILQAAFPKSGLVLITGQTGSGKSTLMAALLKMLLLSEDKRLLTYEAPPEYPLVAMRNAVGMALQHEVGIHVESFADGVRNALRRDPDVIMLGESRDAETIAMTIRASETGHTVYSTVHASNVMSTIDRMADEFPVEARWSVKTKLINTMRLIVNQQLVVGVNGKRVALREYLRFDDRFREKLIEGGQDAYYPNLVEGMARYGRSMLQDAQEKYEAGLIPKKEYLVIKEAKGDAT